MKQENEIGLYEMSMFMQVLEVKPTKRRSRREHLRDRAQNSIATLTKLKKLKKINPSINYKKLVLRSTYNIIRWNIVSIGLFIKMVRTESIIKRMHRGLELAKGMK